MQWPPRYRALAAIFFLAISSSFLAIASAEAHSGSSAPPPPGIQIPSLTHGQMAVIARYRGDILALAQAQNVTDPTFRRLYNHGNLQFTYCLWGLMPGSLSHEQSPFNECSHAYLATAKALLTYMASMPTAKREADALISEIDADMVRSGASWILCQYSGEMFSTGGIVEPRWQDMFFHLPSLAVLIATVVALAAAALAIFGSPLSRNRPASDAKGGDGQAERARAIASGH